MTKNSPLQNGNDTKAIENPPPIQITKRTVRFGADVYQFRNVTGFGLGEVKNKAIIPNQIIGGFFLFGLVLVVSVAKGLGVVLVLLAIGGIYFNISQPKRYGLEFYVNSGNNKIFITRNLDGIKKVVSVLYEFMKNDKEGSYVINIDQSNASIGVGYAERINPS